MKTSDNDLKVNRNIYPDVVNLIGPKCDQLGPNSIFYKNCYKDGVMR